MANKAPVISANKKLPSPGPYLARVVWNIDPLRMGRLLVSLLKREGSEFAQDSEVYPVKFSSPFYGSTNFGFTGENVGNSESYNDTQKSYGMWFVPPDIGVTVIVTFIEGNTGDGYWISCVPEVFNNQMVPAIGATADYEKNPDTLSKYGQAAALPVAEANRLANKGQTGEDIDKIKKAVHPIADRFLEQGLLFDTVRGITTSSARRSQVSSVYGISTPGPVDRRPGSKSNRIGTKNNLTKETVPVSRLGGTQLVFDDGDDLFQRKTKANEGPPEYIEAGAGKSGDPDVPKDEYFRVRTRTGHQILLHNSEDLIYITNARGSAWIELTSDGKVDIFAADSISLHTRQDFNFRADRDINLEAGRNINIKTGANPTFSSPDDGRLHIDVTKDYIVTVGKDHKFEVTGNSSTQVKGNTATKITGNNVVKASGNLIFDSGASTSFNSAVKHIENAPRIEMNCSTSPALDSSSASNIADLIKLTTFENVAIDEFESWKDTQYKSTEPLLSIMKRVPMHEPWPNHENLNPVAHKSNKTDREA